MTVVRQTLHRALIALLLAERRISPLTRPAVNAFLREPAAFALQSLISQRKARKADLGLAEERPLLGEEVFLDSILHDMELSWREGETSHVASCATALKLHGLVRAELTIRKDLPEALRRGVFARPRTYRAYVRFSTLAASGLHDLTALGPLQMSVKLLGVHGEKLLDEEKHTQDFVTSTQPTQPTPDVRADSQLQGEILRGTPLFYFFNRREPRILDFLMQFLWSQAHTSPLECHYYAGTPCLLGEGQAMQYAFEPKKPATSRIPGFPFRTPSDYLRKNMVRSLTDDAVEFDLTAQVQTDPNRMPIEDATVRWPVHMSPPVVLATLRIPRQRFDYESQHALGRSLSFTPWHSIAEHRPLGSQSRAQKRTYLELLRLRQSQNAPTPREPTGDELFEPRPGLTRALSSVPPRPAAHAAGIGS